MSGAAGRFIGSLGSGAGLFADDAAVIGTRIVQQSEREPGKPRKRRTSLLNPTATVAKQESTMTDVTTKETPAEVQLRLDTELATLVNAHPQGAVHALVKTNLYRGQLLKMTGAIADLTPEQQEARVAEWLDMEDVPLRRALWNSMAGAEEIPALAKRADPPKGEAALAKMLDETRDPSAKATMMQKIARYGREVQLGLRALQGQPADVVEKAVRDWIAGDTGQDSALRKNILDAAMNQEGHRIYGAGVQADGVVRQVIGNASAHAGSKLGGSEDGTDGRIRASIPKAPKGEGAGSKPEGAEGTMPGGGKGESPNPGSGPNDGGGGETKPATLITRSGTTGGLGNSAGADSADKKVTEPGSDGKGKKKKRGEKGWNDAEKAELAGDLLKWAPARVVPELQAMGEDELAEGMELAADAGADLLKYYADTGSKLAKSALNSAIAEWMSEDLGMVKMKQWVAEALATAEEIPLELAKTIMAWQPPATRTIRLRQAA